MDQRRTIAELLRIVAELVERSSTSELEDVLAGRASLIISGAAVATTPSLEGRRLRDVQKRRQPSGRDLDGLIARLRSLPSREAGFALLMESQLTKRELEAMARLMDLPVVREDDAEQLRRKIIEEAIGARLNSQAIRGQ